MNGGPMNEEPNATASSGAGKREWPRAGQILHVPVGTTMPVSAVHVSQFQCVAERLTDDAGRHKPCQRPCRIRSSVTNMSRADHSLPAFAWIDIFPLPRSGVP